MRRFATLGLLMLAATLIPLSSGAAEAPAVCAGRVIPLAEDEILVERTLYFHGQSDVGNVDAQQDALTGGSIRLIMNPTAPTAEREKTYAVRLTGVVGNPNSGRNPNQGYWYHSLDGQTQRIVCAGATVFASTANGQLPIALWIDGPRGAGTPFRTIVGQAAAGPAAAYTVNFGVLDVSASDNLLIQLDSAPPGALAYYDSVGRPSRLTYVTVEKVPAP